MHQEESVIEGIIVRTALSGEADLVVTAATPTSGKVALLAKHARKSVKRFGGTLDVFDRGVFEIRKGRGSLGLINGFNARNSFVKLRSDLQRITLASLLCESYDLLTPQDATESNGLFAPLNLGLEAIDAAPDIREALRSSYLILADLLNRSGFLDADSLKEPTAKNLLSLLLHLEQCAERELKSKGALSSILKQLRASQQEEEKENGGQG